MIEPGTQLNHYEVLSSIGSGGMGEVWKARDAKLGRQVAIKTLPDEFARDPERLARFEREAKLLASLNHPNIAAIYGLEEHETSRFLVLELVEGETLAGRIGRGPIPVEECLRLAFQIAEALEAAHEKGVIHRDLKPANIKVTPDGKVKVLDFGLAKALEGDHAAVDLSQSPTLSIAATQQGVILGTAAYMSPEQARGVKVDKRADIWAFGCVLYEMLTGRQVFGGELMSDVMASVLKSEPSYEDLPLATPPRLHALIQRCLEKDPKQRWHDVGDVRVELEQSASSLEVPQPVAAATAGHQALARWVPALSAAVVLLVGLSVLLGVFSDDADGDLARFSIYPAEDTVLSRGAGDVPLAVSPNGQRIAFLATSPEGVQHVWLRLLGSEIQRRLEETAGARTLFWAPDSERLGFIAGNTVRWIDIATRDTGSVGETVGFSASWGVQDTIVIGGDADGVTVYDVGGAMPRTILREVENALGPQFLSDGVHFVYGELGGETNGIYLASVEGEAEPTLLQPIPPERDYDVSRPYYARGHIFYVEDAVLWALPFDEDSLKIVGERQRVTEGVPVSGPRESPIAVSESLLAYWNKPVGTVAQLRWFDREGNPGERVGPAAPYNGFHVSPVGDRLSLSVYADDGSRNIYHRNLGGGPDLDNIPVTREWTAFRPRWSNAGDRIVFSMPLGGRRPNLFITDLSGAGPISPFQSAVSLNASDWSRQDDRIVYEYGPSLGNRDLYLVQLDTGEQQPLALNTDSDEHSADLSPGDSLIAYVSNQTGRYQVWVSVFPEGERRLVSSDGGHYPTWGSDSELFYLSDDGALMSTRVRATDSGIETSSQEELFRLDNVVDGYSTVPGVTTNVFSPSPDGLRFLFAVEAEDYPPEPIHVILNWRELLEQ